MIEVEPTSADFPDFETKDLKRLPDSGGSSDAYEIAGQSDIVAIVRRSEVGKEITAEARNNPWLRTLDITRLTRGLVETTIDKKVRRREKEHTPDEKADIRTALEKEAEKLNNGGDLCRQYLGESFMQCKFVVRENQNGFPVIFRVQKKLPSGCKNLADKRTLQKIVSSELARENLSALLGSMRKMIDETGMVVDILTLGNIAYDENTQRFYIFDVDPLITSTELEAEKSEKYVVDSTISNQGFKTATGVETNDCMQVTLEHLRYLEEDICGRSDSPEEAQSSKLRRGFRARLGGWLGR
jgi:hypothetical protein